LNVFRYALDGTYEILTAIDNRINGSASALNFQGNQYKKLFDKTINNLCTLIYNETFREYFDDFQRHQKYPVKVNTCPYPTGPNEIKNFRIQDYGDLLPAYVPGSEKWKLEIRFIDGEEVLGGYNLFVLLRNQKSLMMGGK
jgi:Protein of unknown function (DUF1091)